MINFINSWAQGIILAVIIATIIEIILPEGNNKKYVKTIIGIYVLFVMVYPLISKISNKNINIESIIDNANTKMSKYEIDNNIALETNGYIEETYKQKLEEDIRQKLNERGYEIDSFNLYIETDDNERYGQINSIVMQINKIKELEEDYKNSENYTVNKVDKVEKVEIKISNTNVSNNSNNKEKLSELSKDEINSLREYLNTTYGVEKERIHINE